MCQDDNIIRPSFYRICSASIAIDTVCPLPHYQIQVMRSHADVLTFVVGYSPPCLCAKKDTSTS